MPAGLLPLAALLALMAVVPVPPAAAQAVSPLQGRGVPDNATQDVYLSVYLDRLLEVNEVDYLHSSVFYCVLTWRDPSAYAKAQAYTSAMLSGNYSCEYECTDWAGKQSCCDNIWLPSLFFRNAKSFPQDRASGYRLYLLPDGRVAWTLFVQGVFFQPMDIRRAPFDSWDLIIMLDYMDTAPPGHPGVTLHLSSGGTTVITFGKGDAVSSWKIDDLSMEILPPGDFAGRVKHFSTRPSDPNDPLGFTTTDAALLRTAPPGATNFTGRNSTVVTVKIRISRFWSYHLLNTVLPVVLLGLVSFVVFFLERTDLSSRLNVVVTLFLAMAAVQFVISGQLPATGYVLPTSQSAICTYVLLALIAVESIVVYRIETWHVHARKAEMRRQARQAYLARRRAAKQAAAAAAAEAAAAAAEEVAEAEGAAEQGCEGLPVVHPQVDLPSGNSKLDAVANGSNGASDSRVVEQGGAPATAIKVPPAAGTSPTLRSRSSSATARQQGAAAAVPGRQGARSAGAATGVAGLFGGKRSLARSDSLMLQVQGYDAWLAYTVDCWALGLLLLAYVVTTILIYTLQCGYIDLFAL